MTSRYTRELASLDEVYEAAFSTNINSLSKALEAQIDKPLIAIGSGGSFSTATLAAQLHEWATGLVSRAATPLSFLEGPSLNAAVLCLTASGRNHDICAAFKAASIAERGPVSALVMSERTPIHALAERFSRATAVSVCHGSFRDGFLAVATLVAASVILTRVYHELTSTAHPLPTCLRDLENETLRFLEYRAVPDVVSSAVAKPAVSLLFSPLLCATAVDLESRFVEAALGALHTADFRNFGHGRHHWMAKRTDRTGLIALVGGSDAPLADKTLALIPERVETCRIDLHGEPQSQMISALIVGLYASLAAGRHAGIDPSKPGVPQFGRRLYRLSPVLRVGPPKRLNQQRAISRKREVTSGAGVSDMPFWDTAYERALDRISASELGGVVFDYDGTLCRAEDRYSPLGQAIGAGLEQLVELGLCIGVATGRGPSAGDAMRQTLPCHLWDQIVVGYYNGAVVTVLSDERDPLVTQGAPEALVEALGHEPSFSAAAVSGNGMQITFRWDHGAPNGEAFHAASRTLTEAAVTALITMSSHSIDINLARASKLEVVSAVSARRPGLACLRIGDQGRWPGNDATMLDHPLGLSVDAVSGHPAHCWNLAPAGVCGVDATLYYISCLTPSRRSTAARLVLRRSQIGLSR